MKCLTTAPHQNWKNNILQNNSNFFFFFVYKWMRKIGNSNRPRTHIHTHTKKIVHQNHKLNSAQKFSIAFYRVNVEYILPHIFFSFLLFTIFFFHSNNSDYTIPIYFQLIEFSCYNFSGWWKSISAPRSLMIAA